ncbi:MAG: MopE-related protein [Myxococcota bacterium]|nr:MopE-related protein [Myxococcota bacterium]
MVVLLLACVFITPGDAASRRDLDGDGYASVQWGGTDCDDSDAAVHPGAIEVCNGIDDDCSGGEDDLIEGPAFYLDSDGDGYGNPETGKIMCAEEAIGRVSESGDCDDTDGAVNPGALEICNGVDDDCDGGIDDDDPEFTDTTFYRDMDGDGFGVDTETVVEGSCVVPDGYVVTAGDCDDSDPLTNPDGVEVCGGGDEDCDGLEDEADGSLDAESLVDFYLDSDGDRYAGGEPILACEAPVGALDTEYDCDETDVYVHPGMLEACDTSWDDNCDGVTNSCTTSRADAPYSFKPLAESQGAGQSLAVGDFDGDGSLELAVGAPAAGLLYEVAAPITSAGSLSEARIAGPSSFGACLVSADADQDGDHELAVCAPDEGAIYRMGGGQSLAGGGIQASYTGATSGFGSAAAWIDAGKAQLWLMGSDTSAGAGEGSVFLFGVSGGDKTAADAKGSLEIAAGSWADEVGAAILGVDSDGDGVDELAMTATDGSTHALLLTDPWTGTIQDTDAYLISGFDGEIGALAAGDWDGDGREDLAVGIPDDGGASKGLVLVFTSRLDTVMAPADAEVQISGRAKSGTGAALLFLQDRDGDGAEELMLGAPDTSEVLLFHGGLPAGSYDQGDAAFQFTGSDDATGSAFAEGQLGWDDALDPMHLADLALGAPGARSDAGLVAIIEGQTLR